VTVEIWSWTFSGCGGGGELLGVTELEGVRDADWEGERDGVSLRLGDVDGDALRLGVVVSLGLELGLGLGDPEGLGEEEGDGVSLGLGLGLGDPEGLGEEDGDGVSLGLGLELDDGDDDGVSDGEGDGVSLGLGDSEGLGEEDGDGVSLGLGLGLGDSDGLGEEDGDGDSGSRLKDKSPSSPPLPINRVVSTQRKHAWGRQKANRMCPVVVQQRKEAPAMLPPQQKEKSIIRKIWPIVLRAGKEEGLAPTKLSSKMKSLSRTRRLRFEWLDYECTCLERISLTDTSKREAQPVVLSLTG
jgi:hypothetical protein